MKGTRLICNVIIFLVASQRLPEFQGYKGRAYPGQPAPCHQLMPVPRRMSLPPDTLGEILTSDWSTQLILNSDWSQLTGRRLDQKEMAFWILTMSKMNPQLPVLLRWWSQWLISKKGVLCSLNKMSQLGRWPKGS